MKTRSWVLVADSSRAILYEAPTKAAPLQQREVLVHPEGRLHNGDLVSDAPGRDTGGAPGLGPRVMDDQVSPKTQESLVFANALVEKLEKGRNANAFDALILVAPPRFLGILRDNLTHELNQMVVETVAKDLVRETPEKIRNHLQTLL